MASDVADLILYGGPILTMEASQPRAEAIAIAGGQILAVGAETEVMAHAGPSTRQIDLQGRTLLPGFIDAHGHFANALQVVDWANIQRPPAGPVTSIAELQQVLREHVARHPVATGEWVIAYGYDVDGLSDGRALDKADLDALFPENPVMVIHNSNHGAVLNSCALALAGYDASTPDPAGGVIVRRPGSTEPAGLVMETAFIPLFMHMPQPSDDERLAQFEAAQRLYTSKGITTVQDGATVAGDLDLFRRGAREGSLCIDLVLLPLVLDVPHAA